MGRSVYVATVEGFTGKSAVALGLLDALSRRVERVGVFRPVVRVATPTASATTCSTCWSPTRPCS